MGKHVIIGAGGGIANSLQKALLSAGHEVVLFSRRGAPADGCSTIKGSVLDAALVQAAMAGADVAYLLVGFSYNIKVWERDWPQAMANCLQGAEATGCALMFFDNVYAYGPVEGPMTEDTPYRPTSRKGKVRAQIAQAMQARMASGSIRGMIVRAADFYGPGVDKVSFANTLVFERLRNRKAPQALVSADEPHSYSFVPDMGPAMLLLAQTHSAWGQIWHLPTASPPLTTRAFAKLAGDVIGYQAAPSVLPRWMIRIVGYFVGFMAEVVEMLYQNDRPYHFSSEKFEAAFGMPPTAYEEGIRQTVIASGKSQEPAYSLKAYL